MIPDLVNVVLFISFTDFNKLTDNELKAICLKYKIIDPQKINLCQRSKLLEVIKKWLEYKLKNYGQRRNSINGNLQKNQLNYSNNSSPPKPEYDNRQRRLSQPITSNEIKNASAVKATCILDNGRSLNVSQLSSLIKESSFVIANDTGPAHMAAHLNVRGITLFGKHTTAYKVSIERENFKAVQVEDLNKLSPEKIFEKINI